MDEEFVKLTTNGGSFVHHITPGQQVIAVSSGVDTGGVSKVTMFSAEAWTCCRSGICSSSQPSSVPRVVTQDGGVGSTVSNGVWTGVAVTTATCRSGFTLTSYNFAWWTTAEDFHGNQRTGAIA